LRELDDEGNTAAVVGRSADDSRAADEEFVGRRCRRLPTRRPAAAHLAAESDALLDGRLKGEASTVINGLIIVHEKRKNYYNVVIYYF